MKGVQGVNKKELSEHLLKIRIEFLECNRDYNRKLAEIENNFPDVNFSKEWEENQADFSSYEEFLMDIIETH